jgi:hypothetical protein
MVLAVIMVVILLIIGLALIRLGMNSRLQAVRSQLVINAKNAADAGMTTAVKKMRYAFDHSQSLPVPGGSANFTEAGTAYTYGVINDPNTPFTYGIDSTGTAAGTVSRTVHSKLQIVSSYFGIGVKDDIHIFNGGTVGTIPTGGELTIQTNTVDKSGVVINNGVIIPGDVVVGPGGSPDTVIDTKKDAMIQGEARPAAEPIDFKPVNVPTLPAGQPITYSGGIANITSSGAYSGNISVDPNKTLRFGGSGGNLVIFIDGNFTLKNTAKLTVAAGSTLKLYVSNNLTADNGSFITNEIVPLTGTPSQTQIETAAMSFSIYGTSACQSLPCQSITIQNSGNFYGTIYAPNAFVDIKNSGNMYGAVVGGSDIWVHNSGNFYFVEKLREIIDPNLPSSTFAIVRWWEE